MNYYITFGTYEFLEKLKEKYKNESMLLLSSDKGACLLHQTMKKSLFQSPKKFKEIISVGDIHKASIALFTYIPVSREGKPIIEYLFKKNAPNISVNSMAIKALKPVKGEDYLVISFWENNNCAKQWIEAIRNHTYPSNHFLNGLESLALHDKKPYFVMYSISE